MAYVLAGLLLLAALFFFLGILLRLWRIIVYFKTGYLDKLSYYDSDTLPPKLKAEYVDFLNRYNSFFKALSPSGKDKFLDRVLKFMNFTDLIGINGLKAHRSHHLLIGSAAIQLTFHLDTYMFNSFSKIYVFPDIHVSAPRGLKIKGGATESGKVMLSWKYTLLGFKDPHDNLNLALHEFAHALEIDIYRNPNDDRAFYQRFTEWRSFVKNDFETIQESESPYLRKYAGTNWKEFFAVCVEHFFETPKTFKQYNPKLFGSLCILLNTNPLDDKNDFVFKGVSSLS